MAWTRWYSPKQARQLETDEIRIAAQGTQGISDFVSVFPVRSISTSFGTFIREESNSLVFTDFGLPSVQPLGIEMRLQVRRLARIQDKTVQLWNGSKTIGENLQNLQAEDDTIYGAQNDRWGVPRDYELPLGSSQFGVVIDLQPHTEIPCADTVILRSVRMRVYYSDSQYIQSGYVNPGYVNTQARNDSVEYTPGY
jgi:hypothetical protein